MNFKYTQQYAKGEEILIAEFIDLNDAKIFAIGKTSGDELEKKQLIYRIYDGAKLLLEFNKERIQIPIQPAKYAHGECDFYENFYAPFRVNIKAQEDTEKILARFINKNDAHVFVIAKCDYDTTITENDLFFIFHGNSLLEQLNKRIINKSKADEAGDQGNEKKIRFRPTPLPTKPRLGPGGYWVEDEENKDDDKDK